MTEKTKRDPRTETVADLNDARTLASRIMGELEILKQAARESADYGDLDEAERVRAQLLDLAATLGLVEPDPDPRERLVRYTAKGRLCVATNARGRVVRVSIPEE